MSDCKCQNCHCDHHCGKECLTCRNDICINCECEHCSDRPLKAEKDWQWQDSGIEMGF